MVSIYIALPCVTMVTRNAVCAWVGMGGGCSSVAKASLRRASAATTKVVKAGTTPQLPQLGLRKKGKAHTLNLSSDRKKDQIISDLRMALRDCEEKRSGLVTQLADVRRSSSGSNSITSRSSVTSASPRRMPSPKPPAGGGAISRSQLFSQPLVRMPTEHKGTQADADDLAAELERARRELRCEHIKPPQRCGQNPAPVLLCHRIGGLRVPVAHVRTSLLLLKQHSPLFA